jgi:hypothetical protein
MKIDRRRFIKSAGGLALASVAGAIPVFSSRQEKAAANAGARLRVAVFYEPDFPGVDFSGVDKNVLTKAFDGLDVKFLTLADLQSSLTIQTCDVFVMPFGSAFPAEGWTAIHNYLLAGGNWVNLGGVPFSVPVVKTIGGWDAQVRQTEYHKKLGITQAFPVSVFPVTYRANEAVQGSDNILQKFICLRHYELYVRFSNSKEYPNEDGSTGPKEAVLTPLVSALNSDERSMAAPFILIDRIKGEYAGGRWVLSNFEGTMRQECIRTLVEIAAQGSLEFIVQPTFACYRAGEKPSFSIGLKRPVGSPQSLVKDSCKIAVSNEQNTVVGAAEATLTGDGNIIAGVVDLILTTTALAPGFYEANCSLAIESPLTHEPGTLQYKTGFWVYNADLIANGKPFSMDGNYFQRDGVSYPVTGTTYMASDAHRKFLLEANPAVWDKDFQQMKVAGINMVRTGIWSGWKNYLSDAGVPNEAALRAMDAFILTARKYDIPIIYTFFAFVPEAWGGANPYLDPKAIEMQKKFISMFTGRYGMVNDIIWDLINEPSFCNPNRLWSTRPNYDAFEVSAWNTWLKGRGGDQYEQYRTIEGEQISLPASEDFDNLNIFNEHHPIKVIDYRLFAQEMFANWVKEMAAAIRASGNRKQLVTVGQDEGGTGDRPNNQFIGDTLDFTCIHNWWFNDDLVWDSVMTKTPGKLNLVEETGVMFYENMDGGPWRTEDEVRNLLERKLAVSLGTGGAGFIEWIWNTNPYMNSDNEAAIGLLRVDGSAKPELEPVMKFARFCSDSKKYLVNRQNEDVVMVIPHSQMFSTRNFATEATQKCIRALYYNLHIQAQAVSEYNLKSIAGSPKLVIVPSPRVLNAGAWEMLKKLVNEASTLLITGAFDADEHWLPVNRSKQLGVEAHIGPVMNTESLEINGAMYPVSYRGDKLQRIEKAELDASGISKLKTIQKGKGAIIWSPLPIEVSDSPETITALYDYSLKAANIQPVFSVDTNDPSILILPSVFETAALYMLISETDRDVEIRLTHLESKVAVPVRVPAQRTVSLLLNRRDGKIIKKN